jgi:triphosphoribosyl-dephospho-CoA synthase
MLATGLCAQAACILEATARKPGNVHRYCDFADLGYVDFLLSGAAIAPVLEVAVGKPVGVTILDCIRATRQVVTTNTNLGIVLLLAPLAAVPRDQDLRSGVERILAGLTRDDARLAYEAIRLAQPGGLGEVKEQDVRAEPTDTLRGVMALAADRDLIARQYADGFREVLDEGVPALVNAWRTSRVMESAIVSGHIELLARHPDSLIARKRGTAEAAEAQARAQAVLASGGPETGPGREALQALDRWLREPGQRRNPGTTADLVTACLFAALRSDTMELSGEFYLRGK